MSNNLKNEVNLDDHSQIVQTQITIKSDQNSGNSRSRINPLYIKLNEKWTDFAKSISVVNKIKVIFLKDYSFMALFKTHEDFRETQRFLDANT